MIEDRFLLSMLFLLSAGIGGAGLMVFCIGFLRVARQNDQKVLNRSTLALELI